MARTRRPEEDNQSDDHEGIELYDATTHFGSIRNDTEDQHHDMSLRADEQPLLNGDGEDGQLRGNAAGDDIDGLPKDPADREGGSAAPGLFVWLLTLSAGLSGLLFGCTSVLTFALIEMTSAGLC